MTLGQTIPPGYLYNVLLPALTGLALPAFTLKSALHFFFMQDIHFPGANTGNQELAIDTPRVSDVQQLAELTNRLARTTPQTFRCPQTEGAWRSLIQAED